MLSGSLNHFFIDRMPSPDSPLISICGEVDLDMIGTTTVLRHWATTAAVEVKITASIVWI